MKNLIEILLQLLLFAILSAVGFGASEIINPGGPFGPVYAIILLTVFAFIPLLLYIVYINKRPNKRSVGIWLVSMLSFVMSVLLIGYARISTTSHENALLQIQVSYIVFLVFAAISIPIIDWYVDKKKNIRVENAKLGKKIAFFFGVHVLLFVWMYVALYLIAFGVFLTSW